MRRLTLALAIALGCDAEPMRVLVFDTRSKDDRTFDVIVDACRFWGLECVPSTTSQGALLIVLTEHGGSATDGGHYCGASFDASPCSPSIWTCDDGMTIEHEIGHVFLGNDHSTDTDNVMRKSPTGRDDLDATDAQIKRVQAGARSLAACPPISVIER